MLKTRVLFISVLFCLLFGGAIWRLVDLQFVRSSEFTSYRERRLTQFEQKAPRRGRILDAKGRPVAVDEPTQDLWIAPVRRARVGGRRVWVSSLAPLTPEQMLKIAAAKGDERGFEYSLACTSLAEGNSMVAELARRLNRPGPDIARALLDAALSGSPQSAADLAAPRFALADIDFPLALEIRSARANPYADGLWSGTEIHTGSKRSYPAGRIMAHLTGTTGKLTAEEYVQLRGRWRDGQREPGTGKITKQGRVFFSILDENNPDEQTDEQIISRLTEVRREGRMIRSQAYFANETVGRGGLEQWYNQVLRGRHRIQHSRMARSTGAVRRYEPVAGGVAADNGQDIRLSIDLDIQRKTYDILSDHIARAARRNEMAAYNWQPSGTAILMNPNNGRIYSMVSLPSYDPNTYNKEFNRLKADPHNPLLDRALGGIYPPGSVVKPIVGLAGMTEDTLMPGQTFHCDKVLMLGGARFTCLGRHGDIELEDALMKSCNIFFYHAGEQLGGRKLFEWYTKLGLGRRTGIDVAGESAGLLPGNAFTGRGWATGNTYHMSIGQGIAVTPLQIAVAYCALANARGNTAHVVRPHLLIPRPGAGVEAGGLDAEARRLDEPLAEILVDPDAVAQIREGMWRVVQGKPEEHVEGTGFAAGFFDSAGNPYFEVGGKTGTAEWSKVEHGRPVKQVSHVWFAAFAPFDKPELVVVVMLPEAGGGGGGTCAPIARDLIRMWFDLPQQVDSTGGEDALG